MNCGYGNLEYQQFYSLEVPINDEYLELSLLKFDNELNTFIDVLHGVHIATNCKIKLAKFYALFYDKQKQIRDIRGIEKSGMCNELDNWDIIKISRSNSGVIDMTILNNDQALRRLTKVESLLMIENESICNDNKNNLKSIFDNVCYKVVVCYVLPSNIYSKNSKNVDPLYFSVLKIPCKQCIFTYKTLTKELEATNKYEKIVNLQLLNKYSLMINVNGQKYDSLNENEFMLKSSNNNNSITITFEDKYELNKQRGKEHELESLCSDTVENSKYFYQICEKLFCNIGETHNDNELAVTRLENEIKRLENKINISNSNSNKAAKFNNFMTSLIEKGNGKGIEEDRKEKELKLLICKELLSIYEIKVTHIVKINKAFNQFNGKYGIKNNTNNNNNNGNRRRNNNVNNQFVSLWSKKLVKINDCINLYYKKSYISSNTFEMKCQCFKLGYDLKYSPIVCIEKKLLNRPNILILKLDRGDISANKTSHTVKFGKILKLNDTDNSNYNLFGVSYHSGNNDGGHYTARIKKLGTNDEWYYCNDSHTERCGYGYRNQRFNYNVPCDGAMFMCYSKE